MKIKVIKGTKQIGGCVTVIKSNCNKKNNYRDKTFYTGLIVSYRLEKSKEK